MSSVQVEQVNPRNEPLLKALWEIGREAEAERAQDVYPPWELFRTLYAASSEDREVLLLGAFETVERRGEVVGAARIQLPLLDNQHACFPEVFVAPAQRRRGIGTALVAEVEQLARAHQRTTVIAEAVSPLDSESPGVHFARSRGYAQASSEDLKACDLLATEASWPGLEAHAAERLAPYDLVWWTDPAPEEHVPDLIRMFSAFLNEAPLGDLDLREQSFSAERIREGERRRAETGLARLLVAGRAPDGTLAGYTELTLSGLTPHIAFIDSTLVMPEHRGHRLGLAMKVRLHQLTRELFPDCTTIATGNAGVNSWMNAVNDKLGYRTVERLLEFQKVLVAS